MPVPDKSIVDETTLRAVPTTLSVTTMRTVRHFRPWALALVLVCLVPTARAHADFINGNFSAGLTGWTASDTNFVTASGNVVTFAMLNESDVATEVTLYQD